MSFPNRLKQLRNEKGLYQKELADILGVSRPTITQYENGTRTPDHETLNKIADYFNISLDYLLGRGSERTPADKIKEALSGDPLFVDFWDKLKEREDLRMLFKQTKEMTPEGVRQIIRIIKAIGDEEGKKYNEQ